MSERYNESVITSLRYSKSLSVARRDPPKDSPSRNHELLVQAGFIRQESAGIYTILPFGMRVMQRIEEIIRKEMNGLGAEELTLPILHPKEYWERTGRWDTVDVLYRLKSRYGGREYGLAPTTEEVAAPLARDRIKSYRDLPFAFYQISRKFRDEKRAKSGIVRGREFQMKDMYSFHSSQDDFADFYQKALASYLRIFNACGLEVKVTEASGGEYTKKATHEFHVVSDAGEDNIIYCSDCTFAQNTEITKLRTGDDCIKCGSKLDITKSMEIGHIFDLGDKFTKAFDVNYHDKNGLSRTPIMGCYGIGISRLMGAIVESHNDSRGILWPPRVSPFDIHLVGLNMDDERIKMAASTICRILENMRFSVLFDDREDVTVKDKFVVADLIGIPTRLVISSRTVKVGSIEVKDRMSKGAVMIKIEELGNYFKSI